MLKGIFTKNEKFAKTHDSCLGVVFAVSESVFHYSGGWRIPGYN